MDPILIGLRDALAVKGTGRNPLWDAFIGITRGGTEDLDPNDPTSLGKAFMVAVWAYRCAKIRADTLASIPFKVLDKRGEPVASDSHPLIQLFGHPNRPTRNRLLYRTEMDMTIWGTAYWEMSVPGFALQRLNPTTMRREHAREGRGELTGFRQEINGRVIATWDAEEIAYFHDYDPFDDFGSIPPMQLALSSAGVSYSVTEFIRAYFLNDATPGGMLTTDQPIDDTILAGVKRWWSKTFKGIENKGKVGIAGYGMKFQSITPTLNQMAMSDISEDAARKVCGAMGVRESVAGATRAVNFATAKEDHIALYIDTVLPEGDAILDALNEQLVPFFVDDGSMLVLDRDSIDILQEDRTEVTQRASQGFEAGYLSMNDARMMDSQEPFDQDYVFIGGKLLPVEMLKDPERVVEIFNPPPPPQLPPGGQEPGGDEEPPPPTRSTVPPVDSGPDIPRLARQDTPPDSPPPPATAPIDVRALQDNELRQWRRKARQRGVDQPFEARYLPDGLAAILRYDLTRLPEARAFALARKALEDGDAGDDDLLQLLSDPDAQEPDVVPDVDEEDVAAAVALWRAAYEDTPYYDLLDAEPERKAKSPFVWAANAMRYRDVETGTFVSTASFRAWLDDVLERHAKEVGQQMNALYAKQQTVEQWETNMRALLKEFHTQAVLMGRGGAGAVTTRDLNALGGRLRSEYSYLANFADTLRTGSFTKGDLERMRVRAGMYANATRRSFFEGVQAAALDANLLEKRRVLDPAAEHCDTCQAQADLGWVDINSPDVTLPGEDTDCLTQDRCLMEFRNAA